METVVVQTDTSSAALLRCVAEEGMFPHESGILIQGTDRWYESMIDSDQVQRSQDVRDTKNGRVRVRVVCQETEKMLVELPRQVVAGGRRIWVPTSEVEFK